MNISAIKCCTVKKVPSQTGALVQKGTILTPTSLMRVEKVPKSKWCPFIYMNVSAIKWCSVI